MDTITFHIEDEYDGERIDKVIAALNDEWSRSQVQQWIKSGLVTVNGQTVKANYKCEAGDSVAVSPPEPEPLHVEPEPIPLDIYYEDEDVLVVNKPRGMVVHPAPGHMRGTLVNALLAHCRDLSGINGVLRPGIVHRIDKDTSGLLMVAKNDAAHRSLVEQLVNKTVTRRYKAIVHGVIPHDYGTIDAPIGRDKRDRKKMAVTEENGKEAVTHFRVLERFRHYTYVECQLETGRTHQIRVHMKYIGYPLAGDPQYGPKKTLAIDGQALHAGVLGFRHPRSGEYLEFEAPLPPEFAELLDWLRKND
ncbi:pseudouridine synthase [Geobacillus thermoleovorans]|uniref:Pseudouridine synthase n=1 Tax=Geobacillus thermoleovorans TaxID=33941 RepID=A0A2Z3N3M3_GEOTH|nr:MULTISPECIES: RluA family pseudouridine synthase [Geobacillus]AWO73375.1 RluA family pseudouridine synthase [Geobacillus thermoleovorans]EQB97196.1 RNA pseudouridine synthase [Geobacillus sp. A8]MED3669039.1 RluA family pseudouridine synthase [Geobacillus kaustophilus]MED4974777.1 RluA family pseudouridine synthase [Geobacillus thermoleovorans]ODA17184.1 pseudouridine synthase [Geobacillus thermoleovorans]